MQQRNDDHYLVVRLGRNQETLMTSLSAAEMPPRFDEWGFVMLVADGLGEGGSGSVASRVALSTLAHLALHYGKWNLRIDSSTASEIFERMEWYYHRLDAEVLAKSRESRLLTGMSTALTAAYSVGDDLFIAHVGHSRAYLFRDGALIQLTKDHTIERHLTDTGRPASVERRAQDLGHILTDAVGARGDHPFVEVERFRLINGDCVLLCTNGLTDMVSDDRIAEVLALREAAATVGNWRVEGTLYVTQEPCPMCAGALVNARIVELVYGCANPKAGAVHTLFSIPTDPRLNHRMLVTGGVLASDCAALLSSFFARLRVQPA